MKQCPKCNFSCGDDEIICKNCGYLFPIAGSENTAPAQNNSNNPDDVPPQGNFNNSNGMPPQGNFNNPNGMPSQGNFNNPNGMPPQGNLNNPNGMPPQGNFNNPNGMPPQDGNNWQNPYGAAPNPSYPVQTTNGMSIASLVLGIVGVVTSCCGIGFIFGIISLIFGILSMKRIKKSQGSEKGKGLALAGIILSCVAILIAVYIVISVITNPNFYTSFMQEYRNAYNDALSQQTK